MTASGAISTKVLELELDLVDVGPAPESQKDSERPAALGGLTVTQSSGESKEEQRRLRRLFVTTRSLLQIADEAEDEREVVTTVVQAAAIWHDVDARAYRRDLQGRFVLDVWLPGADLTIGPRDFSVFSVVAGPVARISSIAEQQQLGWHNLSGELVLLPIAVGSQFQPQWVLAIPMGTDAVVPSNLLLLCETLGLCLERMAARRAQELRTRLTRDLVDRDEPVAQLANAALAQLTAYLGAGDGRLLMGIRSAAEAAEPRTMAATSTAWTAGPAEALEPGQAVLSPRRLSTAFSVAPKAVAILDLAASSSADFNVSHTQLLDVAVGVFRPWLAGVLDATAAEVEEPEPTPPFEPRISEELARAKRFHLETGLIVVDPVPAAEHQRAWARAALPVDDVVMRELRTSDVIGRLEHGEICALLVHTSAQGTAAVASRLRQSLDALATQHGLPSIGLGVTTFGLENESVTDVVGRAREDARRRAGEQL